jgi:hypothetical protein
MDNHDFISDNTTIKKIINEVFQRLNEHYDKLYLIETHIGNYTNNLTNILPPLKKHVLLVAYCNLYDQENMNLNHWINEIISFVEPLITDFLTKVKPGNQGNTKRDAIDQVWYRENKINSERNILSVWKKIVNNEHLNYQNYTSELIEKYREIFLYIRASFESSNIEDLKTYLWRD